MASPIFSNVWAEPALIAKSSILLDVKPWDDETDMTKLEDCVRSIQLDGLVWGQCKYMLSPYRLHSILISYHAYISLILLFQYTYWNGLLLYS